MKSKHPHPNWDDTLGINDIALLVLEEELDFNEFVGPIELPSGDENFTGYATTSGWGFLKDGKHEKSHDTLLKTTIPLVSSKDCSSDYKDYFEVKYEPVSMICAGIKGKSPCRGDSGGPLICGSKLCGIVSWIPDCGSAIYPGVFTRVTTYIDFIKSLSSTP